MSKLYGVPVSPMVRKVLVSLELKGIIYEIVPVTPFNKPDGFLNISPLGKIPAWQDQDVTLADSTVICEYLEDRYPDNALYPAGAADKAKARWIEEYADTIMLPALGSIFFERVAKKMINQPADESKVQDHLEKKLPPIFNYLETLLPDADFLFGADLQLADIALITHFINLAHAGVHVDSTSYPTLAAYVERVFQHPAIAHRISEDQKIFA
ncbi:glutathione S-transferase family protein [Endozoicomonas ascidiicola]|uniref:glutathione S-transferase family protein n=1 Tax=Endozoicomonas ascidiicola TaxID=1698521 RepID=UPI000830A28F|nr:glutathione S-transferase family protein [Endozoicomonas ascidiicola]